MNYCKFFGRTLFVFTAWLVSQGLATNLMIQECCNHVQQWSECHSACMLFASNCPPDADNKTHYLIDFCPQIPSSLDGCFNNISINSTQTQPTPSPQLLNCCNQSPKDECRNECIKQITLGVFDDSAIQQVIGSCGPPLSANSDPIWNCFLLYASQQPAGQNQPNVSQSNCLTNSTPTPQPSTPQPLSIKFGDWPRLHCCSKANDSLCSEACYYEYTGSRTTNSWNTLNTDCIYRATEGSLVSCLDDVTARCSQGCSGLSFCSNFNNRPLTSFRHCTASNDAIAKTEYTTWLAENIIAHPKVIVHTKDLNACYPEKWKVVSCIFQLQPCQQSTHTSLICKDDCLFLMNSCRASSTTKTPEEICEILSPSYLQTDCISLDTYLNESRYYDNSLTTPCSSNPCVSGRTCVPNHQCNGNTQDCQPYHCIEECTLGNPTQLSIKHASIAHVTTIPSNDGNSCHGYVKRTFATGKCTFGQHSENVTKEYCITYNGCSYNNANYTHGQVFTDDCNTCTCHSGHVTCTSFSCYDSQSSCTPPTCSCHAHYKPVCTTNGLTLPNLFFASCHGYTGSQYMIGGSCSDNGDPCDSNPCSGSKCIPHRHTCVSENGTMVKICPQYKCVSDVNCERNEVICAKNGRQYNLCEFTATQEMIDYSGYCQDECSSSRRRPVCGVNGETYVSSCHAKGFNIAVDYIGECIDVPSPTTGKCEQLEKCQGMPFINSTHQCIGSTPPGACCPQCGCMVKLNVDKQQLARNRLALGVASISSTQIINRLKSLIDTLQCEVYGHQWIDGSFVLLIIPSNMTSPINIDVCNMEGTKLAALINRNSPIIFSDVFLSFFIGANASHAYRAQLASTPPPVGPVISGCVTLRTVSQLWLHILLFLVLVGVVRWS